MSIDIESLSYLRTPAELQSAAEEYNWDDGFDVPNAIADHPSCDLSVALKLFWLAEAIAWYTGEIEADEYNRDWVAFCSSITGRILEGYYQVGTGSFDPHLDRVQLYKYGKQSVPDILLTAVTGK